MKAEQTGRETRSEAVTEDRRHGRAIKVVVLTAFRNRVPVGEVGIWDDTWLSCCCFVLPRQLERRSVGESVDRPLSPA